MFAQRSLHSGAGGYGALLTAWGGGAVVGSLVYARWRRVPNRTLIALGALSLGIGMLVMAAAPSLAVAIPGAALAGVANGLEAVAVKTALQEQVEQRWMALIMSLSESTFSSGSRSRDPDRWRDHGDGRPADRARGRRLRRADRLRRGMDGAPPGTDLPAPGRAA